MIRYHGIFGANSALRAQIVPKPNPGVIEGQRPTEGTTCPGQSKRWAQLLARVFQVDVLECPKCVAHFGAINDNFGDSIGFFVNNIGTYLHTHGPKLLSC